MTSKECNVDSITINIFLGNLCNGSETRLPVALRLP